MMETAASPGPPQEPLTNGVTPPSPTFIAIDPTKVVEHLAAVVTIALGANREDLEKEGNLLSPSNHADTIQRCTRFAADSQVALYIQKEIAPASDVPDGPVDGGMHIFSAPSGNDANE
jgi:dynein heavy chain 1